MTPLTIVKRAMASALIALTATAASAADWPVSQVEVYVPANPGGSTDTAARTFAQFLDKHIDGDVIVVNQAGGGGAIAVQSVADHNADGSRLLVFHAMLHAGKALGRSPYSYKDLTPLAIVSENSDVYVAAQDAPYNTLPEMFEYAAANPNTVLVGSQLGGTTQIKGQALANAANGTVRIVDVGGGSKRLAALLGGQVQVTILSVKQALQYSESGDLKVLAVLNRNSDPFAPDWPTTVSQGVEVHFPASFTVYGPPDMSGDTLAKLDATLAEVAADPEYQEAIRAGSQTPAYRNAADTVDYLEAEFEFVDSMVK